VPGCRPTRPVRDRWSSGTAAGTPAGCWSDSTACPTEASPRAFGESTSWPRSGRASARPTRTSSSTTGDAVGDITDVLHLPGQDLLVVRRPDNRETLVPFVADIVPEVDLAAERVVLDPPVGLLEDEATP